MASANGNVGDEQQVGNPAPLGAEMEIEEQGDNNDYSVPVWDPLPIFPEEVWKMILGFVTEPKDLLNCQQACPLFNDILKPTKCNWLFSEVFPHVFHYLPKQDILACRSVRRNWNKVVDGYLENHRYYRPYDPITNDNRHTTRHLPLMEKGFGWTEFHTTSQIVDFMDKLKNPARNPFVCRSVWIQFQEDINIFVDGEERVVNREDPQAQFWPTVFRFLSEYGGHIWYFCIGTFGSRNTTRRFLYLMRNCLSRLPNLKNLHIFGWISEEDDPMPLQDVENEVGEDGENVYLEDEDVLSDYLTRKPLPVAPSLRTLEIEYMEELPDVICSHLTSSHRNQLQCLQLTKWNSLSLEASLPKLQELHLKLRSLDSLNKFFIRLKSPLGKLNLDYSYVETKLDIERLFRLISNNFGDTLRVLQLTVVPFTFENIPALWLEQWKPQPRLRTPHLQTLQLEGFKTLCLNFLVCVSSSLQYLHLRPLSPDHRTKSYESELIDIYQYMHCGRLYESNVWKILPKLQTLSAEVYDRNNEAYSRTFYNRERWQFFNRGEKNDENS